MQSAQQPGFVYLSPFWLESAQHWFMANAYFVITPHGESIVWPGQEETTNDIKFKFVPDGTLESAIAFDMGKLEAEEKNRAIVLQTVQKLQNYEKKLNEKISEVQATPPPVIPLETQFKIDTILAGLDVINFKPKLASFGDHCAQERELLDRCYLGNSTDTTVCHDYAMSFQQCVYQDDTPVVQQQQQNL